MNYYDRDKKDSYTGFLVGIIGMVVIIIFLKLLQ